MVAALLASRLLFLPDGPWEQDEAIFAGAVHDYKMVAHRPHPPGFPAWIGLARLLHPLTGDAILSMQLLSSVASVVGIVVLAAILATIVSGPVALCVAMLFACLPGVWFHAPRAFTTTPAVTTLLLCVWCWWPATPSRRRLGLGWALLGLGALIRPQLLPAALVLAFLGVYRRRHEPATAVALAYIGLIVFILGYVPVITDTGGFEKTLDLFLAHLKHATGGAPASLADVGLVRALGGPWPALAWFLGGSFGLALLRRPWLQRIWVLGLVAVVALLIAVVHPSHPRYAIPLILVVTPGIALIIQRICDLRPLSRPLQFGVLGLVVVVTGISFGSTLPAMTAMANAPIPPVAALRRLASDGGPRALVTTAGITPYARYAELSGHLQTHVYTYKSLIQPHNPAKLTGNQTITLLSLRHRGLPGATVHSHQLTGFPPEAWDLSQRRYSEVYWVDNPIVLGDGVSAPEINGRGEPFAWLGKKAVLIVPGVGERLELILHVDRRRAPVQVKAQSGNITLADQRLRQGTNHLSVPLERCQLPCTVKLVFGRAIPAEGKRRRLSARLYGAWVTGERLAYPQRWNPGQPMLTRARGVELSHGFHGPERFGEDPPRPGAWLADVAVAEFPAVPGTLEVTLALPPPREGVVTLETNAHTQNVEVGGEPQTFTIPVAATSGKDVLRIKSHALVPQENDPTSSDRRRLGAILFDVVLRPDGLAL